MQKFLVVLGFFLMLSIHINAQSQKEAKPSFDCAKATTKVEKIICSDESGQLQNLDRYMAKAYKKLRQNLNKNEQNKLLTSQRLWLQTLHQCESKECVKELLQNRGGELQNYTAHTGNVWLGTYELQQNLYFGWFKIQKCDTNNICEIKYEAILNKSEFNDMHICEEVAMKLKIKNNNKAIAYYDGEEKCRLNLELNKNGILITEQKPKDCYMGCGAGTEISINSLYHKE
ncbi:lysozyme inhibitor LprI family protein [Helicobacter trogontum]|uniref:lysozyme inhibitor LprI family protein n=1 Tax=Helicobacter trogontum TaxID=50960 RepID=UPI001F4356D8|nr:lysozyme inhibitor LprI family protein [Helicobacter trogontum]